MFLGQKLSYFRQNKARILESRWHLTPPPPHLNFLQERHPLITLHLLNRKDNCWISVLVYEKRWKLCYEDLAKWCEACLKLLAVLRPETLAVRRTNWQILSVSREKKVTVKRFLATILEWYKLLAVKIRHPIETFSHAPFYASLSPGGLVFLLRICYAVHPLPLRGVMVIAWCHLTATCTCLEELQIIRYHQIYTGKGICCM